MLTRILFLFALVLGSTILLTGAWTNSLTSSTLPPEASFVPQTVPLDADIIGSGIDAKQLLQKALEKLDPKRTTWLKTKIRQSMIDAGSTYVAEGHLQLGPNHCARLELNIGKEGRLLVVSDGEMIALERKSPGVKPHVEVARLPDDDAGGKEKVLHAKCCGGPRALLMQLQEHLQSAKLQTGLLYDVPVIQIKGDLSPAAVPAQPGVVQSARHLYVYLDAQTLWPCRLEWWSADKIKTLRLNSRIEFLDPELNREQNAEECMRLFSFRPEE